MLILLGAMEACENPAKPGTRGVHILVHNFRGLELPSARFIYRAWVKASGVGGGPEVYGMDPNTHTPRSLLAKEHQAGQRSPGWRNSQAGGLEGQLS